MDIKAVSRHANRAVIMTLKHHNKILRPINARHDTPLQLLSTLTQIKTGTDPA